MGDQLISENGDIIIEVTFNAILFNAFKHEVVYGEVANVGPVDSLFRLL